MPLFNPTLVPDPLIKTTITGTNISGSTVRATSFTGSFSGSHFGDGSGLTGISATVSDPLTLTTLTASNLTGSDAKFTSITASFSGNGSGLTNLTASQMSAFQNDVRAQLSAGAGIGFSGGIISNTGIVSIVAGDNIGVSTNTVSLSSSLSNLTAVTSSNITGSDIKTTTLSASNITGSDAKLTSVTASFSGNGAGITSLDADNISAGTLSVARGGTGAGTFTANALLTGNTTSQFGTITPNSNSGSALVSNGTNWIAVPTSSFGGSGLTISNASNNRVVTSTGGTGLNGEEYLTFDSSTAKLAIATTGLVLSAGSLVYESISLSGTLPQDTTPAFLLTTAKASTSKGAGDIKIIGGDGYNATYTGSSIYLVPGYNSEFPSSVHIGLTGSLSAIATGQDVAKVHIYNPICLSGTDVIGTSGGDYSISARYPVFLFTGSSDRVGTISSGVDMQLLKVFNISDNNYLQFDSSTSNLSMTTSGSSYTGWSNLRLYTAQSVELMYLQSVSKWVILNTTGLFFN